MNESEDLLEQDVKRLSGTLPETVHTSKPIWKGLAWALLNGIRKKYPDIEVPLGGIQVSGTKITFNAVFSFGTEHHQIEAEE